MESDTTLIIWPRRSTADRQMYQAERKLAIRPQVDSSQWTSREGGMEWCLSIIHRATSTLTWSHAFLPVYSFSMVFHDRQFFSVFFRPKGYRYDLERYRKIQTLQPTNCRTAERWTFGSDEFSTKAWKKCKIVSVSQPNTARCHKKTA